MAGHCELLLNGKPSYFMSKIGISNTFDEELLFFISCFVRFLHILNQYMPLVLKAR
jgi:hypothetical protein